MSGGVKPWRPRLSSQLLQKRYKILGVLGRGGMGVVYLCEDLRLPGKRWALKEMVCPDPALAAQARESFEQEAAMLSTLRHRQLPELVDYFSDEDRQYLVMEYVEGPELLQLVQRQGPITEVEALRWGLELCGVLEYLHTQETPIIYRDLKPMNVIVTEDRRHVKLVDFGLARYYRPNKRRDTHASGSAGYAPPELWEDLHQTDARSDVYSLGATLFYALTGKHPSPVYGTNRVEQHREGLSPGTVAVIDRCLAPDPADRYPNVAELASDLRAELEKLDAGNTVLRRRHGSVTRRRANRKLPGWIVALLVLATLAVAVGGVLVGSRLGRPGPTPMPEMHDPYERFLAVKELRERAQALYDRGDYARAIDWISDPVRRNPEEAALKILLENAQAARSGKPLIHLPVVVSLTGSVAREGYQMLHGLYLAQHEHNQKDAQHPVVLDLYDDRSQIDRLLELSQQVAANKNYPAGIGPFDSQKTLALAPFLNGACFPMLSPMASDPRVGTAGPYVFAVSDNHLHRVDAVAERFLALGLRKLAIQGDEESRLSSSTAQEFASYFETHGGTVVLNQTFNLADPDFTRQIPAIKDSGADCLYIADYRATVVAGFVRRIRAAGIKLPIACQVPAYNPVLTELWTPELDGLLMSTWFDPESTDPAVRAFRQQFQQEFRGPNAPEFTPGHREAYAYDALNCLLQVLEQAGTDRKKVQQALAQGTFTGVTGSYRPGHQDSHRPVYLVEMRQRVYVPLPGH